MARASGKNSGKSKIRFIMLEAELSEGDLSEVTEAIQNALKPKQQQLVIQQKSVDGVMEQPLTMEEVDDIIEDAASEEGDEEKSSAPKRKTTYRTPNVVDINFDTTPSLKEYAADHPPSTLVDKHLVILGWADEVSELEALDVDQVYTAFRHLSWPSHQKDFSQPLRDLKKRQLISGTAKDGFKVNHIGRGAIEKLTTDG